MQQRANIVHGQDAIDFVTKSRTPRIVVPAGSPEIAFNADRDLMGVPEHLRGWARRWNPVLNHETAYVANSVLDKREWAELDREIIEMVKLRRNAVADLLGRGLVKQSNLAEMLSQWRVATERVRPSVNMDGRTRADRDRTDRLVFSVPVPMIRADYDIGRRELLASRKLGVPLDTFEAGEAASSVAEEEERILFNGDATIVVGGNIVYGYTTHPQRDTATAAAYGGGDFGTISNILPTFLGMLAALAAKRYHGPFMGYIAQTQYHEMLDTYTDGSGQTGLDRVRLLPQILDVKASDFLAAGSLVLVQMSKNVIDLVVGLAPENREWESGDGQALYYAVFAASAPRLKQDAADNLGVAHATAC